MVKLCVAKTNSSVPSNFWTLASLARSVVLSFPRNAASPGRGPSALNTSVDVSRLVNLPGMSGVNSTNGVVVHWFVESEGTTAFENASMIGASRCTIPFGAGAASCKTSVAFFEHEQKRRIMIIRYMAGCLNIVKLLRLSEIPRSESWGGFVKFFNFYFLIIH